jgi:ubiquinone/menaquinone biosynthesis C-methylase UbiE
VSDYLLDKKYIEAKNRLTIKENIQDPATLDYLEKIGIKNGWHCLELGGGAGSITAWLCEKVGVNGRIEVIDTETRFLERLNYKNLEVIKADISGYDFGAEKYDLIHGRDILLHIRNRDKVLEKLCGAVKNNGWILLEEPDTSADTPDPLLSGYEKNLYNKVTDALYHFLQRKGVDPYYGASLLSKLKKLGFTSLNAEGRVQMFTGGYDMPKTPHIMAFEQLKDDLIGNGYTTKNEFAEFLKLFRNNNFSWREGLTISVWGRKPMKLA